MEWALIAVYVVLSTITLLTVANNYQARGELQELRERIVRLEQTTKKPVRRTSQRVIRQQPTPKFWHYSGKW